MSKEAILLTAAWIMTTLMLIMFVPKNKIRPAFVIFSFKQLITWFVGIIVVELGLIEYPVDIFHHACKTSFSFEYYIYPAVCVVFNLHYPEKKCLFRQFVHYFSYCSVITVIEVLVEKYTEIITYIHWTWYITWITLFLTFFASRKFYTWFYSVNNKKQ